MLGIQDLSLYLVSGFEIHPFVILTFSQPQSGTEEIVTCHLNPGASLCSLGLTFLIMFFEVPEFLTLTYQLIFFSFMACAFGVMELESFFTSTK